MKYLFILVCGLLAHTLSAQSELEIRTDGIVVPRIDTGTVVAPLAGQVIFDTSTTRLMYFDGIEWKCLSGAFERKGTIVKQKSGVDTDDFVFGRDLLPVDTMIATNDRLFFFDQSTGAFRGGMITMNSSYWNEDSLGVHSFAYGEDVRASGDHGATAMGYQSKASGGDGATALGNRVIASGHYGSTAIGYNNIASGEEGATAIGSSNRAIGDYGSTTIGYECMASGSQGATALGDQTSATGDDGSTALGSLTEAIGNIGATALGDRTMAIGDYGATAFGSRTMATGDDGATALGDQSVATGKNGSTAIGYLSSASGNEGSTAIGNRAGAFGDDGTIAMGYYAETNGDKGAVTLGWGTLGNGRGATVVGMFNDTIVTKGADTAHTNPVFIVGNGNDFTDRSNALTINKRGDVHFNHSNNGGGGGLRIMNSANGADLWRVYVSSSTGDLRFYSDENGNSATAWINDATGAYSSISDKRMKKDFRLIGSVLPKVLDLQTKSYLYQSEDASHQRSIGFIAQEVEKLFPELVSYNKQDDLYGVNYAGFSVVAIKAIQEQQELIQRVQKENRDLQNELVEIKKLLMNLQETFQNESENE